MRWRPAGAGLVLALCMLGACADARVDAIRVRAKPSAAVERPRVVAAAPIEVHGPPAEARLDPETAATPAAAEVVRTLATLRDSIVETRYQGRRDGDGGFGFGTLLFVTDETGETIAYGWHGERSLEWGFMPARVIYGRVAR